MMRKERALCLCAGGRSLQDPDSPFMCAQEVQSGSTHINVCLQRTAPAGPVYLERARL